MRERRTHVFAWMAILIFVLMVPAVCAWAQNGLIWDGYHKDATHKGQNSNSDDIGRPENLNLIWAWPRAKQPPKGEDAGIVDNSAGSTLFRAQGIWQLDSSVDAWKLDFLRATAVSREKAKNLNPGRSNYAKSEAVWFFPKTDASGLPYGDYQIWVWVPPVPTNSSVQNTSQAEYTIHDDNGATTVKFDQRDGGSWRLLADRSFTFGGSRIPTKLGINQYYVSLTDLTDDTDTNPDSDSVPNLRVVADAIRFVPTTGMQIYSSPVSLQDQFGWTWKDTAGATHAGSIDNAPFVYVGTIEAPLGGGAPETGSVYCINSATPPVTRDVFDIDDPYYNGNQALYDDDEQWRALADSVATPRWQYPRSPKERMDPTTGLDIEGPIEGGMFSSPVLALMDVNGDGDIDDGTIAGKPAEFACVVTGMDRQTYAFDARTGQFLWKGPGITLGEKEPVGWILDDNGGNGRADSFGGTFHYVTTGTAGVASAEWNFSSQLSDVMDGAAGLSYAVYAWMPAQWTSDKARCRDARYRITYMASGGLKTEDVVVDQSLVDNQARWVKLGSSFWQVQKVELLTDTTLDSGKSTVVVADAMMIVPEDVGAFGYCSPVVQSDTIGSKFPRVFVVSGATGRAMSFTTQTWNKTDHIGKLDWIYPKVRTSATYTGPAAAGMGEIGASPAYHNGALYVAAYDGRIHCINALDPVNKGEAYWVYDSKDDDLQFTSSPAIDEMGPRGATNPDLYIASTNGYFFCLDGAPTGPSAGEVLWQYPDSGSRLFPLEGFRYSTPAIATDGVQRRAWVAGSGGKIYSFDISDGAGIERRLYVEYDDNGAVVAQHGSQWYGEPSSGGPVQGSIAIDGNLNMYVGTMSGTGDSYGTLRWFNAKDGSTTWGGYKAQYKGWRTEAENLFSSPNVTDLTFPALGSGMDTVSYIYIGGSDGRVYAFSRPEGAWGGKWIHSMDWPFQNSEPNSNENKEEETGSDPDVQFDIFDNQFYNNCTAGDRYHDPEPMHASELLFEDPDGAYAPITWVPDNDSTNNRDWIVSEDMKVVKGLKADPRTVTEINDNLKTAAKARRSNTHLFPSITDRTVGTNGKKEVYFEWGETINLVLWNLPKKDLLYGSNDKSKMSNIRFYFKNQSAGESAGSALTLSGLTKVLREYTVLDGDKSKKVTVDVGTAQEHTIDSYEPLQYEQANGSKVTVKRCYAVAQIELKGTGSRPPSPGPGWVLTADLRMKTSTSPNAPTTQITIPLAKLNPGNPPSLVLVPSTEGGTPDTIVEQPIGINNPLGLEYTPPSTGVTVNLGLNLGAGNLTNRYDPSAHFNGNAVVNSGYDNSQVPVLDMGQVRHGTSSPQLQMAVADRSAVGCTIINAGTNPVQTDSIQRFRISAGDLRWPRGLDARVLPLPWEEGTGSNDYPDIYKRHENYRKASDDMDPSRQSTTLPPVTPTVISNGTAQYNQALVRPDTMFTTVTVPKFQPANLSGYSRTMQAYVDSDGDRNWDSGDSILGKPSTYQEAYRKFRVGVVVPPDPRIEVEEQLVDIGRAPHGLGEFIPGFNAFNMAPDVQQWFKGLTIKNSGNVNLANMRIGHWVPLLSDSTNPTSPMPGVMITSSLDEIAPFNAPPFVTNWGTNKYGYTLTKARVGDPDPTVLTIPDRRKWDMNFDDGSGIPTQDKAQQVFAAGGWPTTAPLSPKVSVRVPLSQPIGSYQAPFVPVFADIANTDSNPLQASYDQGEPIADPTFQLKVTVRENQVTGGVSPATIPQIDMDAIAKIGDSTPAAFRDPNTGNVYLFWSSNRMTNPAFMPSWPAPTAAQSSAFANAPWFIYRAQLAWDAGNGGWQLSPDVTSGQRWWDLPTTNPYLLSSQWPTTLLKAPAGADVMPWKFPSQTTNLKSVRHYSPVVAENREVAPDAKADRNWLAWAGTANISAPNVEPLQEHRIFYTDVTGGKVNDSAIMSIEHDPETVKRSPSMEVYGNRMWMFWQAGNKSNWSIFYSVNDQGPKHEPGEWKDDMQLRTPDCLAAVSGPNAIHRVFWYNLIGDDDKNAQHLMDVVYAGTTKLTQNSDIMLNRYAAVGPGDRDPSGNSLDSSAPSRRAQPLPRVFGQKLRRDPKYGFFTGQHLAWTRMGKQDIQSAKALSVDHADMLYDYPDRQSHLALEPNMLAALDDVFPTRDNSVSVFYNLPYIRVVFPKGIVDPNLDVIVSGTDGSVTTVDSTGATDVIVDPSVILPELDDATGIYTYKYPEENTIARQALGDMLVDYSAGIVRFTAALTEKHVTGSDGKEKVLEPEVYADYTPQTWRLTTDTGVDNSPRAFIERTPMVKDDPSTKTKPNDGPNPSMMDWTSTKHEPEVDRLWVLWRKAGTGVDSSTVFFKTYRVGVDLTELGLPPIPMSPDGTVDGSANLSIVQNLGPWEVDRTGRKIYFSEVDERYRSLARGGSSFIAGTAPGPITLEYQPSGSGNVRTVNLYDVYWTEELPEQSLFGYAAEGNVNEGSIYAFADPNPRSGTLQSLLSSKIWVFWTSTRAGTSDLFWETISPNFMAR